MTRVCGRLRLVIICHLWPVIRRRVALLIDFIMRFLFRRFA